MRIESEVIDNGTVYCFEGINVEDEEQSDACDDAQKKGQSRAESGD